MTIRRTFIPRLLTRLLTLIACVCLGEDVSQGQVDKQDPLQIIPPPVPRYRREKPAFQVSADPASKPLPPTKYIPPSPPMTSQAVAPPDPAPPTKEEIAGREARLREIQRRETEDEIRHARLMTVGKALGFVAMVLIGLAAARDIVRQVLLARRATLLPVEPDEDDEWKP